jgi:hypothetical protein
MTCALLRRFIFPDNGLVAVGVRLDISIDLGKIEVRTRDSPGQMIAEMPIARAAKNNRADFSQEFEPLPRSAAATPSRVSRAI